MGGKTVFSGRLVCSVCIVQDEISNGNMNSRWRWNWKCTL